MTAVGVLFVGFGVLAMWSAFHTSNIFDVLHSVVGAPVPVRTDAGVLKKSGSAATAAQPGAVSA
jgi:hypothetical protein